MEGLIDAKEFTKYFVQYLESNDLVIVPRLTIKTGQLRQKFLRKKSLTYKEIADAHLWGDIGKKAVEAIAKKQLEPHEKFKAGNKWKIHMAAVERIAKNRATW